MTKASERDPLPSSVFFSFLNNFMLASSTLRSLGGRSLSSSKLFTMQGLSLTNLEIQSSGTKHPSLDDLPASDVKCHMSCSQLQVILLILITQNNHPGCMALPFSEFKKKRNPVKPVSGLSFAPPCAEHQAGSSSPIREAHHQCILGCHSHRKSTNLENTFIF